MCTLEDRFVVTVCGRAWCVHGSATSCAPDVLHQRAMHTPLFCRRLPQHLQCSQLLTPPVICSSFSCMEVKVKAKYNCKTVTIIANEDSIAHWLRASFGKREVGALGKDDISKTDEFLEKFQTAFGPPPPLIFGKSCCAFRDKIATKVRMFSMAGLLCII